MVADVDGSRYDGPVAVPILSERGPGERKQTHGQRGRDGLHLIASTQVQSHGTTSIQVRRGIARTVPWAQGGATLARTSAPSVEVDHHDYQVMAGRMCRLLRVGEDPSACAPCAPLPPGVGSCLNEGFTYCGDGGG